jgi:hypothetical protein
VREPRAPIGDYLIGNKQVWGSLTSPSPDIGHALYGPPISALVFSLSNFREKFKGEMTTKNHNKTTGDKNSYNNESYQNSYQMITEKKYFKKITERNNCQKL